MGCAEGDLVRLRGADAVEAEAFFVSLSIMSNFKINKATLSPTYTITEHQKSWAKFHDPFK